MEDAVFVAIQEYNSLRTEIINRTGFGFQLLPVGITLLGLLVGQIRGRWALGLIFTLGLVTLGLGTAANVQGICGAHGRLIELEKEINRRIGEHVLVWETERSLGVPIACSNKSVWP